MSYSEIVNQINELGIKAVFENTYKQYAEARVEYEKIELKCKLAKDNVENCFANAHCIAWYAAQNEMSNEENGAHVIRGVVDNEIVHFKIPADDSSKIFISYDVINI